MARPITHPSGNYSLATYFPIKKCAFWDPPSPFQVSNNPDDNLSPTLLLKYLHHKQCQTVQRPYFIFMRQRTSTPCRRPYFEFDQQSFTDITVVTRDNILTSRCACTSQRKEKQWLRIDKCLVILLNNFRMANNFTGVNLSFTFCIFHTLPSVYYRYSRWTDIKHLIKRCWTLVV